MRVINIGAIDTWNVQGKSLSGINLTAQILKTTTNSAITGSPFNANLVTVKATLKRGGDTLPICNNKLNYLGADSTLGSELFKVFSIDQATGGVVTVAAAMSVSAVLQVDYMIDFGGIINLKGNDVLVIEVNVPNAVLDSSVYTLASCNVSYDIIEAIGQEGAYGQGTPTMEVYVIQASSSQEQLGLGNGIHRVGIYNLDKLSYTDANAVWLNAVLTSDKYSRNDTQRELVAKSLWRPQLAAADREFQNFTLFDGMVLNDCALNLSLNGANVTANNNFVVYRRFVGSQLIVDRYMASVNKHANENWAVTKGTFNN